jgi:hypothetical protein
MMALWGHVIRFLRRGKALAVMAVLAPAVLTLAMGSLALLRPAPVVPPATPTVIVTHTADDVPTPASPRRTIPTATSGVGRSHHRAGEPHGIH